MKAMRRRAFLAGLPALAIGADTAKTPRFGVFEHTVEDGPADPSAEVRASIDGPGGQCVVPLFWDGGRTWRFRYSPAREGRYRFHIEMSPHSGTFECGGKGGKAAIDRHGPPVVGRDRRRFAHTDGTPWFLLSDTAWNGALMATREEWDDYLKTRVAQRFTAVQFVMTQWRAGRADEQGRVAFRVSQGKLAYDTAFFKRMDERVAAIRRHGLTPVPVMLWALTSRDKESPGETLSTQLAVELGRYLNARYSAYGALWFLGGDGDYRAEKAERWKQIGRGVFQDGFERRPVSLHPRGMQDPWPGLKDEKWLDFLTYQSGHGDSAAKWRWQVEKGLAEGWKLEPPRPVFDAEPDYEGHVAYNSRQVITDAVVRRAVYSSLFAAPPAGVTYGAHGVWFWSRKAEVPLDHPGSGVALPWRECLNYAGAAQMRVMRDLMDRVEWWTLRPDPKVVAAQTPDASYSNVMQCLKSADGRSALIYAPNNASFRLDLAGFGGQLQAVWLNPRTGAGTKGGRVAASAGVEFTAPGAGDWLLWLKR